MSLMWTLGGGGCLPGATLGGSATYFCFVCVCARARICVYAICTLYPQRPEEDSRFPQLELQGL